MLGYSKLTEYEAYVEKLMKENMVPSFAVGLSKDGHICYQNGFGFRNIKEQIGPTKETVFGIGSITKSITCIAIMQLQEAGMLSVHDSVTTYLPEFRIKNNCAVNTMTIHHFMTHTTGIPPLPIMSDSLVRSINGDLHPNEVVLEVMTNEKEPSNYKELMDLIAEQDIELLNVPGKIFSYNNECYCLLGAIIERVSGLSYESYVKKNILKLIGMDRTGFIDDDFLNYENVATLYLHSNKQRLVATEKWWDTPIMRSTGLLRSTVVDMLKYAELFRTNGIIGDKRILKKESIKSMLTPYIKTNIAPDQYYGYGLRVTKLPNEETLIEHTGNGKAVSSFIQMIPKRGLAAIGLSNKQMAPVYGIVNSLMNIAIDKPLHYSRIIEKYGGGSLPREDINKYVGIFQSGDRGPAIIKMREKSLVLLSYGSEFKLSYLSEDTFKVDSTTDDIVRFFRNSNNKIDRLSFRGRIHIKSNEL